MKNGPAFPVFTVDSSYENGNTYYDFDSTKGMTMLEYYAGLALSGVVADWSLSNFVKDAPRMAEAAFCIGEAMCEEAAKRRGQ